MGQRDSLRLVVLAGVVGSVGVLALTLAAPSPAPASPGGEDFFLTLNGRTQTWGEIVTEPWDLVAGRGVGDIGTGRARADAGLIAQSGRYQAGASLVDSGNANLTSIDNSYLALVADVGLPGLLLVLALGVVVVRRTRFWHGQVSAAWATAGLVGLVAFDGVTRSSLTAFPFGYIALFLVGAGLAEVDRIGSAAEPARARVAGP